MGKQKKNCIIIGKHFQGIGILILPCRRKGHGKRTIDASAPDGMKNYLLPVNVVMPGDWEVQLIFRKGEEIVLRAAIRFDV